MEKEYLNWAADIAEKRIKAFGKNGYSLEQKVPPNLRGEASLGIAINALAGAAKSGLRSPFRGLTETYIGDNFGHPYDRALISGVGAAVTSTFADEVLLPAMKSRARVANVAFLKPIDPNVLYPDPGDVVLRIITEEGEQKKIYMRPIKSGVTALNPSERFTIDHPFQVVLSNTAKTKRERVLSWQENAAGKRIGSLSKPFTTGFLALGRLALMHGSMSQTRAGILSTTLLSSSLASALVEGGQGLLQAQTSSWVSGFSIDNLYGGTQRVNSFKLERPRQDIDPAKWTDITIDNSLNFSWDLLREVGSLTKFAIWPDWNLAKDKKSWPSWRIGPTIGNAAANAFSNGFASVCGVGVGFLVGGFVRGNPTNLQAFFPEPGESRNSPGNLGYQFGVSATNEAVWNAMSGADRLGNLATKTDVEKAIRDTNVITSKTMLAHAKFLDIKDHEENLSNLLPTEPQNVSIRKTLEEKITQLNLEIKQLYTEIDDLSYFSKYPAAERAAMKAKKSNTPAVAQNTEAQPAQAPVDIESGGDDVDASLGSGWPNDGADESSEIIEFDSTASGSFPITVDWGGDNLDTSSQSASRTISNEALAEFKITASSN